MHQMMQTLPDEEHPGVSEYTMFVFMHRDYLAPVAHQGPTFLPWHREFQTRYNILWTIFIQLPNFTFWTQVQDTHSDFGLGTSD